VSDWRTAAPTEGSAVDPNDRAGQLFVGRDRLLVESATDTFDDWNMGRSRETGSDYVFAGVENGSNDATGR